MTNFVFGDRRPPSTSSSFRMSTLLLAGIGLLFFSSPSAQAFTQEVQQVANDLGREVVASGAHRVAVVDFTDLDGTVTQAGRLMADEMTVALVSADVALEIVDRREVGRLLEEIGFGKKGLVSQDQLLELGRMLSAQAIVFGNVTSLADSARLSVRVLEVESARSLTARSRLLPMSRELQVLFYGRVKNAGPGRPYRTESYGDLEYQLFPCRRQGRRVTCEIQVVARRRGLTFSLDGRIRAVDELGTEHKPWHLETSQGQQQGFSLRASLIENIPLRMTLIFEGVATEAQHIALDLGGHPMPIQAPDIPIVQ